MGAQIKEQKILPAAAKKMRKSIKEKARKLGSEEAERVLTQLRAEGLSLEELAERTKAKPRISNKGELRRLGQPQLNHGQILVDPSLHVQMQEFKKECDDKEQKK